MARRFLSGRFRLVSILNTPSILEGEGFDGKVVPDLGGGLSQHTPGGMMVALLEVQLDVRELIVLEEDRKEGITDLVPPDNKSAAAAVAEPRLGYAEMTQIGVLLDIENLVAQLMGQNFYDGYALQVDIPLGLAEEGEGTEEQ